MREPINSKDTLKLTNANHVIHNKDGCKSKDNVGKRSIQD
jgi:hypothetical protein